LIGKFLEKLRTRWIIIKTVLGEVGELNQNRVRW